MNPDYTFNDPTDNVHIGRRFFYAIQDLKLGDAADYLTIMVRRHISLHPDDDLALQVFMSAHIVSAFDLAGNLKIDQLEPLEEILWVEIRRFRTEYTQYRDAVDLMVHHVMHKVSALCGLQAIHVSKRIETVKRYIDVHYSSPDLTVSDLSIKFDVSISYLSRTFKQVTGENLTDYIHTVRIQNAQRLLATTDMPISQVAAEVGYTSSNAFIRFYRSMEGVPPGAYRRRAQQLPR